MDNFLYPLFHSDSIGGDNKSGYSNAEVDKLIDEARATTDDDARIAKMKEADAIVASDCPVIPLMFYTHTLVGSDYRCSRACMSTRRRRPIFRRASLHNIPDLRSLA